MQYLEIRRHTMRTKPGKHLSQEGVSLARRVGDGLGPFARVITSTLPRAFETAIAMGFAVDEQIEELGKISEKVLAKLEPASDYAGLSRIIRKGGAMARFAQAQVSVWRSIIAALPEGGQGLVITHGGFIEAGAVCCLPDADHDTWGPFCDYCEGVRLSFSEERFTGVEMLRVKSGNGTAT